MGAGAVGGYFGARLAQAGRDVTFLVRPTRAQQITHHGLRITSPYGDLCLQPKMVLAGELAAGNSGPQYDLVLLGVKSYALESAVSDFAPAVGPTTMVLPLLNGMRHMETLAARFGHAVLGGVCLVSTDLGENGEILQLTPTQKLIYGDVEGGCSERIRMLDLWLQGATFEAQSSAQIMQEMWQKWVMLASLGALTCLLRGSVGEIEAVPGGAETALEIVRECSHIAAVNGFPPDAEWNRKVQKRFTAPGSTLTSSMYRDLLKGREVEAEQIIGDLLQRGQAHNLVTPLLSAALVNLSVYRKRLDP